MSHSICPLKTSAQHLEQVLASIFTGSTFALESFPFGCAFFTRDLDSAAVLEVVAPGGGCDGSFGTAFGGGGAFGTGSKNFAADDAAGTGLANFSAAGRSFWGFCLWHLWSCSYSARPLDWWRWLHFSWKLLNWVCQRVLPQCLRQREVKCSPQSAPPAVE